MRMVALLRTVSATSLALGLLAAEGEGAAAADFHQTNLVSDIPGLAAVTDLNLKNPWGMSQLGKGPFWVSDQGTNLATLYNVTGATNVSLAPLVVSIPTAAGPTGQVSNANLTSFQVDGATQCSSSSRWMERLPPGIQASERPPRCKIRSR
jgi:hypothetical protein